METIIRRRIRCFGWVQGVGFRWRVRHAARLFGATGWVKNEDDGSVTLELQGSQAQIDRVMEAVEGGAYIRIERVEARRIPVVEGERGFYVAD